MKLMRKMYYIEQEPIADSLRHVFEADPDNHYEAANQALMYILHKSGLIEDGLPLAQFEAAFDAFLDINTIIHDLMLDGIASSEH